MKLWGMPFRKSKKRRFFLGIALFLSCFFKSSYNDQITISFDHLFPTTPLTDVFNSCMKLWGNVRLLKKYEATKGRDNAIITWLFVQHIRQLSECVAGMKHVQHCCARMFQRDDIEYISTIIDCIAYECKTLPGNVRSIELLLCAIQIQLKDLIMSIE